MTFSLMALGLTVNLSTMNYHTFNFLHDIEGTTEKVYEFRTQFLHNKIRQALVTCHFPDSKCNLYFLNTQVYDNESIFIPRQHYLCSECKA